MDSQRVEAIKQQLGERTSEDLLQIYAGHDEAEWTPEAFEAIRLILEERSVPLPLPGSDREISAPPRAFDRTRSKKRLARLLSGDGAPRDHWSVGLGPDALATTERGLFLLRTGASISNLIGWLVIAAVMSNAPRRWWLLAPILLYGLPYLVAFGSVVERPTRHGVAIAAATGSIPLLVLPYYVVTTTLRWLQTHGPPAILWMALAGVASLIPAHLLLLLGALFASAGVGPRGVGTRGWVLAFAGVAVYFLAAGALLFKLWARSVQ